MKPEYFHFLGLVFDGANPKDTHPIFLVSQMFNHLELLAWILSFDKIPRIIIEKIPQFYGLKKEIKIVFNQKDLSWLHNHFRQNN